MVVMICGVFVRARKPGKDGNTEWGGVVMAVTVTPVNMRTGIVCFVQFRTEEPWMIASGRG